MSYFKTVAVFCVALIVFVSCQKEYSFEIGRNGNPPGGPPSPQYGWSFVGASATNYRGCVDTAFYTTISGLNALMLSGTDSAGNSFNISLLSAGTIVPGTYSAAQGAFLAVTDANGVTYLPKQPSNITLQITTVNDSLVEGTFSGTLADQGNQAFTISGGKVKARIGKPNPCTIGGSGIPAVFTLAATGNTCSNAVLEGEFVKGTALTASNYVELLVNVSTAGDWDVSTSVVNGITFSGSGTFTGTGLQSIILTGSGTPINNGPVTIPLTAGSSSCSFVVDVEDATVVVPGAGDYFPTTANSNWIYFFQNLSTLEEDSGQIISTGNTITINQLAYSIFQEEVFGYVYRKANGNYYRYGRVDVIGLIDTSETPKDIIFLKDNVPGGSTWESPVVNSTFQGTSVKYKRRFTITGKDVSLTIRGKLYNNVITVKEDFMLEVLAGTGYSVVETSIISYAKGIGMVQFRNDFYQLGIDIKRFQVF